ncbi:MAG: hypothetical protein R3B70_26175 [Polyangiaceae bacterium]
MATETGDDSPATAAASPAPATASAVPATASPAPATESLWSAEAALLVRPFRTYRALGGRRNERTWRDVARSLAIEGVLLGAFVSLTTAGRMVAAHVLYTAVFWGFLPMLQVGATAAAVRLFAPRERVVPAVSLYLEGLGPYYVFYLALSGLCLFVPDVYWFVSALLRAGALPLYLLGTIVWGVVITWAFLREGLGLSRGRAAGAAGVFYAIFVGVLLGWYLGWNQIQPQVVGTGPWAGAGS